METNFYTYETTEGKTKGAFNIYQGKNGGIYLTMASRSVLLTQSQVKELPICLYILKDFNQFDYNTFYSNN